MGNWILRQDIKCPYCGKEDVYFSKTHKGKLIGRCDYCKNWLYDIIKENKQ